MLFASCVVCDVTGGFVSDRTTSMSGSIHHRKQQVCVFVSRFLSFVCSELCVYVCFFLLTQVTFSCHLHTSPVYRCLSLSLCLAYWFLFKQRRWAQSWCLLLWLTPANWEANPLSFFPLLIHPTPTKGQVSMTILFTWLCRWWARRAVKRHEEKHVLMSPKISENCYHPVSQREGSVGI